MDESSRAPLVSCAHCLRDTTDTYRCRECSLAIICRRCAAEVGLLGVSAMLSAATERDERERRRAKGAVS